MITHNNPALPEQDRRRVADHEEYFNGLFPEEPVMIGIMESVMSTNPHEMLVTTAGTGLAVCFFDKSTRSGALAHVIIPSALRRNDNALKDRITGVLENTLNPLISAGSSKETIKVRLFGGAKLDPQRPYDDGGQIYTLVKGYLDSAGLEISTEDVGSNVGRRIHFFPKNGKAGVLDAKLNPREDISLVFHLFPVIKN